MKPLNRKNQKPEENRQAKPQANFQGNPEANRQAQPEANLQAKAEAGRQSQPQASSQAGPQATQDVQNLFEAGLNDIYSAEKALAQKLPKMMENASSPELRNTLKKNIATTAQHINRLEKIFKTTGLKATAEKSKNIEGLLKETEGVLNQNQKGQALDAGIIAAGQKLKQYEISSLGNLHTYAKSLGHNNVVDLLAQNLTEAQQTHQALNEMTASATTQTPTANLSEPWTPNDKQNPTARRNPSKK